MNCIIGIPARFGSSRFPGKALAELAGRPMIAHVVERARRAELGPVVVATDDARIAEAARAAGALVRMTSPQHASGTDRLAEAVADMDGEIVVNLQGDEPLIDPAALRAVVAPFSEDPTLPMATLARPLEDAEQIRDPNIVKVVLDARGRAMYFSRAPIPFARQGKPAALQHIGLYAYRRAFLLRYPQLAPAPCEKAEQLEQLRALYHGHPIAVTVGDFVSIGVDTPADLERAERLLAQTGGDA